VLARPRYDDGGFSGGNLERPALHHLLADIRTGRIDIVVVYKVDPPARLGLPPALLFRTIGACPGNAVPAGGPRLGKTREMIARSNKPCEAKTV
jgi:hypothetical protein